MEVIDLVGLSKPLPPARFPDGSEHQLIPFDAITWRLYRQAQAEPDETTRRRQGFELLRRCVPSATEENFVTLRPEHVTWILGQCTGQIELASAALGNGSSAAATPESSSQPSTPTTTSSTSASGSGESPADASSTA